MTLEDRLDKCRMEFRSSLDSGEKEYIRRRGEFWKRAIVARDRERERTRKIMALGGGNESVQISDTFESFVEKVDAIFSGKEKGPVLSEPSSV